jgi:dUTP pyrophosphatase
MFKEMGEDLDKKIVEYKQQIEDYKTKLDFDGLVEKYKQEPFDFDKWLKDKGKMFMPPKTSVKVVNKSTNPNPEFATDGASGFDLRADLAEDETITLGIGEYTMVPTGLYFEIPEGFELQVRPRSGLAAKHGVTVLNSPGTVDSDYRGEVKVILINHGTQPFVIANGDRIAQGVIGGVMGKKMITFESVEELSDTERGEGGFGSTGIK